LLDGGISAPALSVSLMMTTCDCDFYENREKLRQQKAQ
jgi:hypothetical protein